MSLFRLPFVVDPGGKLPTRSYPDDAGYDLYVSEDTWIDPGRFADVPAGVRVQLPNGVWGLVFGRSSTIRTRGLLVVNGVIDTGWRGPLFAATQNVGKLAQCVRKGERIAQLLLFDNLAVHYEPIEVSELDPSKRGENGFGSTGR